MGEAGDDLLGRTLGAYRIEAVLGEGATGRVYRGFAGRKPVAIKVLATDLAADQGRVERYFAEAKAVSALGHPNIVDHTDCQQFGQRSFVVMELLSGRTLRQALQQAQRMTCERAVLIIEQLADALAAVHQLGIVHRDLAPENVFLLEGDEDVVKLLGFGLAQLQPPGRAGEPVGTPTYMCPEAALGRTVTPASDVYALGVLAFELIAGRPPFVKDSVRELVLAHASEPPQRIEELCPEVPRALADALADALAKHPAKRPAGMNVFKHRLHAALGRGHDPAASTHPRFPAATRSTGTSMPAATRATSTGMAAARKTGTNLPAATRSTASSLPAATRTGTNLPAAVRTTGTSLPAAVRGTGLPAAVHATGSSPPLATRGSSPGLALAATPRPVGAGRRNLIIALSVVAGAMAVLFIVAIAWPKHAADKPAPRAQPPAAETPLTLPVAALPSDPMADASQAFTRGKRKFTDGDYPAAAADFGIAYQRYASLLATPGPNQAVVKQRAQVALANQATALVRANDNLGALAAYQQILAQFGADMAEGERAEVSASLATLEQRVGYLVLPKLPPGSEVLIDGTHVAEARLGGVIPVGVGRHEVEVREPGQRPHLHRIDVSGQKHIQIPAR